VLVNELETGTDTNQQLEKRGINSQHNIYLTRKLTVNYGDKQDGKSISYYTCIPNC